MGLESNIRGMMKEVQKNKEEASRVQEKLERAGNIVKKGSVLLNFNKIISRNTTMTSISSTTQL